MKLFYIANIRIPTEKAHGLQIMKMCEAFSYFGCDVTLIVPQRKNPVTENPFDFYGIMKNFSIKILPCLDLVSWGKIGFLIQTFTFVKMVFWFSVFKKNELFITRDEFIAAILQCFGKHVIWEGHHGQNNMFTRFLIRRRTKIVVISIGLKRFYIALGAKSEHIVVLHDAVDLKEFIEIPVSEARKMTSLPQDVFIVGYVGKFKTMGKSKGVEDLIKSFSQFHIKVSNTHLLLVGIQETEKEEVIAYLRNAQVPNEVYTIYSHIKHLAVSQYLCASDVLVMNYPKKEHYIDFMSPLKLFEYMASGRTIIASDLPSIREVIDDNSAIMVIPDNIESLTQGLQKAYESDELRLSLSTEAKHRVENYTWENRAKKIIDFAADYYA